MSFCNRWLCIEISIGSLHAVTLFIEQGVATFFAVRHKLSDHSCNTGGTCIKNTATIEDKLEDNTHDHGGHVSIEIAATDITPEEQMDSVGHRLHHHHQHNHGHSRALNGRPLHFVLTCKCLTEESDRGWIVAHVLEMGIALHSVIIGMALGASSDVKDTEALIIALCFHQVKSRCILSI